MAGKSKVARKALEKILGSAGDELTAAQKAALRKRPTGFNFKKDYDVDIGKPNPEEAKVRDAAQSKVRGTSGKAADSGSDPIVIGSKSMPSMRDINRASGSARAKLVVKLEKAAKEGDEVAAARLKKLDKLSAEQESSRLRKSAISRSGTKKVPAGDYMNKETGEVITVTGKELSPKKLPGSMNDYIRNPTKKQVEQYANSARRKALLKKLGDTPEKDKAAKKKAAKQRLTRVLGEMTKSDTSGKARGGMIDYRKGGMVKSTVNHLKRGGSPKRVPVISIGIGMAEVKPKKKAKKK